MEGIAKIQTELAKGKTCVDVKERIERVLTDGDAMLTRFSNAIESFKKRCKQHGHLCSKPKDSVNLATKSKEGIARLAAMTIAQKLKDAGVPTDLCWYTTGQCTWHSCAHKHTGM